MNIIEPILFQSRYQPGAPALCVLGKQVISYGVLRGQMNNVARRALACGLGRGSVVALSTDQPLLEAVLILGLAQAGVITVSVGMLPPTGLKIDAVIGAAKQPFASAAQHLPLDDFLDFRRRRAGRDDTGWATVGRRGLPDRDDLRNDRISEGGGLDAQAGHGENGAVRIPVRIPPSRLDAPLHEHEFRGGARLSVFYPYSGPRRHGLLSRPEHREHFADIRSVSGRGHADVAGSTCAIRHVLRSTSIERSPLRYHHLERRLAAASAGGARQAASVLAPRHRIWLYRDHYERDGAGAPDRAYSGCRRVCDTGRADRDRRCGGSTGPGRQRRDRSNCQRIRRRRLRR